MLSKTFWIEEIVRIKEMFREIRKKYGEAVIVEIARFRASPPWLLFIVGRARLELVV